MNELTYRSGDKFAPVPPAEIGLQTVEAEYWFQLHNVKTLHTEGMCFDREGNLYCCGFYDGSVYRINPDTKEKVTVFHNDDYKPASVKIHRDGRLFICCLNKKEKGRVFSINPDGTGYRDIVTGYSIDDLAFDPDGGFYFTELIGDVYNPVGGVYYVSPDYSTVTPFMTGMATPNGVAMSTDDSVMWITESHSGRIFRMMRTSYKTTNVVYQCTGFYGPDSCEIDSDDNLYVAMCGQGKVLVFNYYGYPIAQILLPDRDKGWNLWCTHAAVRPGTKDLYIIACDDNGDKGSWIFKAQAFGTGDNNCFQFR